MVKDREWNNRPKLFVFLCLVIVAIGYFGGMWFLFKRLYPHATWSNYLDFQVFMLVIFGVVFFICICLSAVLYVFGKLGNGDTSDE